MMRYVHLYVDEDKVEDILKELDGMKAVKKVLPSYYSDIDMDFVGSLERYDTSVPEPFKNFFSLIREKFFFFKELFLK